MVWRLFGGVEHLHAVPFAALVVSFAAPPNPGWKSAGVAHPSPTILALRSVTVRLPYFLHKEQRRFEILPGHWDLPVTDITPAKE